MAKARKQRRSKSTPSESWWARRGARKNSSGARLGIREAIVPLLALLLLSAVIAGGIGWVRYRPQVAAFVHASRQAPVEVVFATPVTGVENLEQTLRQIVIAGNESARRAPDAPADVRQATLASSDEIHRRLAATGWFHDSLRIAQDLVEGDETTPWIRRITVHGTLRRPLLMVRRDGRDRVIDDSGVRLDLTYTAGAVDVLRVVTGALGPEPAVGARWPGRDLSAAVSLERFLRASNPAWLSQVIEIDVSNADGNRRGKPRLVLVTRHGHRIGWGRPVGEEAGIEVAAAEKIRRLSAFVDANGGVLGTPSGTYCVHLDPPTIEP